MDTLVALDIETTGLDSSRDAIIEIGAVRFSGSRVDDEWSSLINPNRHVPDFITGLTGIDDAMLRQAPNLRDVIHELEAFVGDAPILGHNVQFDIGFLRQRIPFFGNRVIDTYELASVLVPNAGRYNLGSLGKELGILLPATHRALDDARVTKAIFVRLQQIAQTLPPPLMQELLRLSEPLAWGGRYVFEEALRAAPSNRGQKKAPMATSAAGPLHDAYPALDMPEEIRPLDPDELATILQEGGPFSEYFPSYEHRPEQVEMLRDVTTALSRSRHLMVEAGTGVGKSFAYLIPAALFAIRNNTRVLISTNTINLQDQLIRKDIPDLQAALHLDLRAAVLKGRGNYLCPRRLDILRRFGPRNVDEMRVLAKVLVWQLADHSGDRTAINLNGNNERDVWRRLSAEDDGCTTETCIKRTGGACPFQQAKNSSQSAHILVVNHALLLADVAAEGKVLPEYSYLILDEAHHLEAATTSALSFRITEVDFERMLKEIGGSKAGVLGRVLDAGLITLQTAEIGRLRHVVGRATDLAFRLEQLNRELFSTLTTFAVQQHGSEPQTNYAWQFRILPSTRTLPGWDEVEIAWDSMRAAYEPLTVILGEIREGAAAMQVSGKAEADDLLADLSTACRRLSEAEVTLAAIIEKPSADQVYWIEVRPNGGSLALNVAPLRVGSLIEKHLWHEKSSVILTSATLTAHGEFQYLRGTLGADEADEIQLGSPFDYENSTLLYVASDMPEPNTSEYSAALHRTLIATARSTGGRMLALFTSYAALRRAAQAVSGPLGRDDIQVYEHGDGASPNALLEAFKASERAVLLGTRSFWEGVDVPGPALSVLFITKLPFDVPTDPLIAARSETYDDPFQEYYLPEAILKFRQGFGRLIRAASDRGVVAILDRRVISKAYGRFFLESLPACTSRQGPAANLAAEAARWLKE